MHDFFISCPFCKYEGYVDTKWGEENFCPQCQEVFYISEEYIAETEACFYCAEWINLT